MLLHALGEQLVVHSNRSVSRTKHELIASRLASNYVENSIGYEEAILWIVVICSNGAILDCTNMKFFLKKFVKCCTFNDVNFNVLAHKKSIIDLRIFYISYNYCLLKKAISELPLAIHVTISFRSHANET